MQKIIANNTKQQLQRKKSTTQQQKKQEPPKASLLYQQIVDNAITKIQTSLITRTVSEKYLAYVTQLLQPPHCQDVMDERVLSSCCAYPACSNRISGRHVYCSDKCETLSNTWITECDSSIPYTRNCVKLLSMIHPNLDSNKLEQLKLDMDKEYNSSALVAALRVKERESPAPPKLTFENVETIDTITEEAKKLKASPNTYHKLMEMQSEEMRKRMEAMSVFYDSEDEEVELPEPDMFTVLWTELSRWYTGHTYQFFHPVTEASTVNVSESDTLDQEDFKSMEIYSKMFGELKMDNEKVHLDTVINQQKQQSKASLYSNDPIVRDAQAEQRYQIVEQSLHPFIQHSCSELGLIVPTVSQLNHDLLETFSFNQRLSSLVQNHWWALALLIIRVLNEYKREEISTDSTPARLKLMRVIDAKLRSFGLQQSQIEILFDLLVKGIY